MRAETPEIREERLGGGLLMADAESARDGKPQERRIEEWVVSNLEGKPCKSASTVWDEMLGTGASRLSKKEERRIAKDGDWRRFRLIDRKGVAVLRVADAMLLKEQAVHEFADDLLELIDAGYDRVVLNFMEVQRLSIQVVVGLAEAHLRCAAERGGRLKLCGLRPEIAEALPLVGLDGEIEVVFDEGSAIEGSWPERDLFRPLPVHILSALRVFPEPEDSEGTSPMPLPKARRETSVRLLLRSGREEGRTLTLGERPLTIGRDEGCGLRVVSPTVSRNHASVERRGDRVVLRDLNSTNGTRVNGRTVSGREAELHDGDEVVVGPMRFSISIEEATSARGDVESEIGDWLRGEEHDVDAVTGDDRRLTCSDLPIPMPADPEHHRLFQAEVIQDVLALTPLHAQLDDESRVGPLRNELQSLAERSLPRRVVVDLRHVAHVSSAAIGVLVAYALKLEREGGELRLSQVCPRVMAVLNQIRLPMLIEIHPTTDEAVLCDWKKPARGASGAAG